MPDGVSESTCQERRAFCAEAMSGAIKRIEKTLDGHHTEVMGEVRDLCAYAKKQAVEIARVEERAKGNTHRLNWLWRVMAGIVVLALAGALTGGLAAWLLRGAR